MTRLLPASRFIFLAVAVIVAALGYFAIEFMSAIPYVFLYSSLVASAIMMSISFYRSHTLQHDLVIVMPIIALILLGNSLAFFMNLAIILAIMVGIIIKKHKRIMSYLYMFAYSVLIIIYCVAVMFYVAFPGFTLDTLLAEKRSPDGRYAVRLISHDEGALGGDTFVELDRLHAGVRRNVKRLYSGDYGQVPEVEWGDDGNCVWIDKHVIAINADYAIVNYNGQWKTIKH